MLDSPLPPPVHHTWLPQVPDMLEFGRGEKSLASDAGNRL